MSDYINAILDDLDAQMFANFVAYGTELFGKWEELAGSGNPGQRLIVKTRVLPVVTFHVWNARHHWPYNENPEDYLEAVRNCFDQDVMERAFGDTIEETYEEINEYWLESMTLQHEHEVAAAIIGAVHAPHSTDVFWKGNPF